MECDRSYVLIPAHWKFVPKDGLKSSPPVCQLPPRWCLQHGEKASAQTQRKDRVNYGLRSTGTYHLVAALLLGSLTQGTFLELLPLECVLHNFFSNRCIFCNLSSASQLSWQNKHTRTASAGPCQTTLSARTPQVHHRGTERPEQQHGVSWCQETPCGCE